MNQRSFIGLGFVFTFAACSVAACSEQGSPGQTQTQGGSAGLGTTPTGGSGANPGTSTGGSTSGTSTGGKASGGSGGMVASGTGGTPAAGNGGAPGGPTGGAAGGPTGGTPVMATGGASAGASGSAGAGGGGGGAVSSTDVTVQLGEKRQEMAGFGINNNWAPAMTDAEAEAMFHPERGLGLSILRIGMASSGGPYNGEDCWSDIRKVSALGVRTIIGTLWSPPARMKTNNSITGGGHLKSEFYEEWAETIAAFPAQVKEETGVDLYGMSPQNETDFASCGFEEPCNGNYDTTIFTGAEYAAFLKVVGPKLKALNPPVKVIAPEASEWLHVWSNDSGCCSEPGMRESSDP